MRKLIAVIALGAAVLSAGVAGAGTRAALPGKIVYSGTYKAGSALFVVSPRGGTPKRLTSPLRSDDGNPSAPNDGKRIVFESNRLGDYNVYVSRVDGTHIRELTFSDAFDGDPAWSRKNKIAFESDRTGTTEIWTINPDGSDEKQLTTDPSFNGDPAWSPDGSKIVFTSTRDGDREIYVMNPTAPIRSASPPAPASARTRPGRPTGPRSPSTRTATAISRSTR